MATGNCEGAVAAPSSGCNSRSSKYTRSTELRRVDDNDIYHLALRLDYNDCWRRLMIIIPKRLNAEAWSYPNTVNFAQIMETVGAKYDQHHLRTIERHHLEPGQSIAQLLIDEWKTSGQMNERPTVGVLLELLIQCELFSAADYVAEDFLNEPKPRRPAAGPAAFVGFSDMDTDGDSAFPNTADLNAAAAAGQEQEQGTGMNLDNYDKFTLASKSVPQQSDNAEFRPVRPQRSKRISTRVDAPVSEMRVVAPVNAPASSNIPLVTLLNLNEAQAPTSTEQNPEPPQHMPKLNGSASSTLDVDRSSGSTGNLRPDESAVYSANRPCLTLLSIGSSSSSIKSDSETITASSAPPPPQPPETSKLSIPFGEGQADISLPALTALNLATASNNAIDNDDDVGISYATNDDNSSGANNFEDEDDDDANLSNSDHHTSNNESSLTTVTGTSGENSFDVTNDSSSTSIDDDTTHNIPDLSEILR